MCSVYGPDSDGYMTVYDGHVPNSGGMCHLLSMLNSSNFLTKFIHELEGTSGTSGMVNRSREKVDLQSFVG